MKHQTLSAFLVVLLAACGANESGAKGRGDGGGGGGGASGGDGGTNGVDGSKDPDADEGPLWDGKLPSEMRSVAKSTTSYALTDDDFIVYANATGVSVQPLAGGTTSSVASGAGNKLFAAGRAVLAVAPDGSLTGWSKAAGAHAVSLDGFASSFSNVSGVPSGSGDDVLVVEASGMRSSEVGGAWRLDPKTLAATKNTLPSSMWLPTCVGHGEVVACIQRTTGTLESVQKTAVFTVDRAGVHVRGTITDAAYAILPTSDSLIIDGAQNTYRLAAAGSDAPSVLVEGGRSPVVLQDGWVAAAKSGDVQVMHADGSGTKTIATGAIIADWILTRDIVLDTTRIRWLPVCDHQEGKPDTNLRLVDPSNGTTVQLSKSCKLAALTYSDTFAFVVDDWVAGKSGGGAGVPTVIDVRDGSKRTPVGLEFREHFAFALGKSRLMMSWYQDVESKRCYFDAHSGADAPCLFPGSIDRLDFAPSKLGKGLLLSSARDSDQDLYALTF